LHPLILPLKTIHKSMKECPLLLGCIGFVFLRSLSSEKEYKPKKQLKRFEEYVAVRKGEMMDKKTTVQSTSEENEILKLEINKRFTFTHVCKVIKEVAAKLEVAKAAESDAFMKLN